jgi:hypothetical protein
MGRGMIVLLMVVWGHLVLFALFGGIVAVVLAARGDLLQAALLGAGCAGLVATAQAIERFAVLKRYGTRARGRRLTFRRVAARAGRIVVAAAIVGLVGISANQVRVIADVGVADWLRRETTSLFEVVVILVVLHLLLFLMAWPAWSAGQYVRDRIYALRLGRAIKRLAGR